MVSKKIYSMHQFDFPSKFYQSVCPIPIENNMHCWWIEIEERTKYKLYNIEDLSKITLWYHSNDTKVMCCVHIDQLITYPADYTLLFTLQLCYKPLGILQRVTNSRKAHISSHDRLQNILTSTFLTIGPRVSKIGDRVTKTCSFLTKC